MHAFQFVVKGKIFQAEKPLIMGILNLTPDSFFKGSRIKDTDYLLKKADEMVKNGVDIFDVGGQSTRPGATRVSENEELDRIGDAILALTREFHSIPISIDTFYASVASEGLRLGASIINDISAGLFDERMLDTVAANKAVFIAMHMRGTPQSMQNETNYLNLVHEVATFLQQRKQACLEKGIYDIWIDLGFGFAKTVEQNYELFKHIPTIIEAINAPLLVGISRKSMIWKPLEISPEECLPASSALHLAALQNGASILRVHDVKEAKQITTLYNRFFSN